MKELLQSHSIVANPASWILLAIVVVGLIERHIAVFKSLEFDTLRKKAKYTLRELAILDVVVSAIVTIAIFMHHQLMTVDRSMFRIERSLTTVTIESKTPILIGGQFDIVKDDGPVLIVKSRRSHKEYRIEKFYLPKERNE
jgi:hypothetical protein